MKILLGCTTDTGAYFVATALSRSASWNPLGLTIFQPLLTPACADLTRWSTSEPPTFSCGMQYYWDILQTVSNFLSPPGDSESEFMITLAAQGISSFRIFYSGTREVIFFMF